MGHIFSQKKKKKERKKKVINIFPEQSLKLGTFPVKLKCKCATPLYLRALDLLCIFAM